MLSTLKVLYRYIYKTLNQRKIRVYPVINKLVVPPFKIIELVHLSEKLWLKIQFVDLL
jgi:hypothetical protein